MSETQQFKVGDKIKRGGIVIKGDGEIEIVEREKGKGTTEYTAYICPDKCTITADAEDGEKPKPTLVTIRAYGPSKRAAELMACYNCGKSLIAKPKRGKKEQND